MEFIETYSVMNLILILSLVHLVFKGENPTNIISIKKIMLACMQTFTDQFLSNLTIKTSKLYILISVWVALIFI